MRVHVAILALMSKHLNSCNQLRQETKVGPALELGAIWAGASGILGSVDSLLPGEGPGQRRARMGPL